jgi:hypothetical protein
MFVNNEEWVKIQQMIQAGRLVVTDFSRAPCSHGASRPLFGELKNDHVADYCAICGAIWWIKGPYLDIP